MPRVHHIGDTDYEPAGEAYSRFRIPDPRIGARIAAALGDARTVLNVGAGTGGYEPADREVTAVEPSPAMRAQRRSPAIDAVAESLPFPDDSFDAAMATFTVHQWPDLQAGLAEVRRVTRGPVVILTGDPARLRRFWLQDYASEVLDAEARRYPAIAELGGEAEAIPIPIDCTDGFNEAYYARPERLLDPAARLACSAWGFVSQDVHDRFTAELGRDLADGTWDRRYGSLRSRPWFEGSLVMVVGKPGARPVV